MLDEKPSTLAESRESLPDALAGISERNNDRADAARGGRGGRPVDPNSPNAEKNARRRAAYSGGSRPSPARSVSPEPARELFKPETCRVLVSLPFDATGAFLKSDSWALDENQKDLLASTGSAALNEWFPNADPRWAALTAFSLAFLTITTQKYATWRGEMDAKKNDKTPKENPQ